MTQEWYCKEKLDVSHSQGSKGHRVVHTPHVNDQVGEANTLSDFGQRLWYKQITIKLPKFLLLIISGAYFVKTCTPGRTDIFSLPFPGYHPLFNLYERSEVMGKPVV
mgnify:CR=1 FL=1